MSRLHLAKQAFSYALVALVATAVDFSLVYGLTEAAGLHYLWSIVLAFIAAAVVNYELQKAFTFKCQRKDRLRQFSTFLMIATVGLGINLAVVYLSVELLALWYMFGKAIATVIAFVWNFIANKCITFK